SGRAVWSSESRQYQLQEGQEALVVDLTLSEAGVDYIKRFTFQRGLNAECSADDQEKKKPDCVHPQGYQIDVRYLIDNNSEQAWSGAMFGQLKRDSSGDPSSTTATGTATYLGAALWTSEKAYEKVTMG